jgi:uroporphyrinogen III methyltransferase/synthase
MTQSDNKAGVVYLVGAGPGDPELITVKALAAIRKAEVLVYDALANARLLAEAPPEAERIDAGKRAKAHTLTQEQINEILAERARAGKRVVRLKGGDPYVFGRGSEEAIYLHERGVACVVIPGLTSAIAGPACAGIPVTHRNLAATVTLITGHEDPTKQTTQVDYAALAQLARSGGTLCFYMGMGRLGTIVQELTSHGLEPGTPAAVVQWGTLPTQRSVRAPLNELAGAVERAGLGAPAIIVVGPVAGVDPSGALRGFERRPLFGRTILITRTRHQSSELGAALQELGAAVLEAPTIDIAPPADWEPIDYAIRSIDEYDWLILTSVNGVEGLRGRMEALELDARLMGRVKIAAIGDATAAALRAMGLRPDLVPTRFVAESLAADLVARHPMKGKRVLMLRADIARPLLREKLQEAGAEVHDLCVYETRPAQSLPPEVWVALKQGRIDWVTFTSSSTARNFVRLLDDQRDLLAGVRIASIGPITSQTVRELGFSPAVEAEVFNIAGLVEALTRQGGAHDAER